MPKKDGVIAPYVHLNGTNGERLFDALSEFADALRTALEKLREVAPNGRDYYPEPGMMDLAQVQHSGRDAALRTILNGVENEMEMVRDQINPPTPTATEPKPITPEFTAAAEIEATTPITIGAHNPKPKKPGKFETECRAVSERLEIPVQFFEETNPQTPFEDDGTLHIYRRGIRACFDVSNGQNLSGRDQNVQTCKVLTALNMAGFVGPRTLVDETDDENDGEDFADDGDDLMEFDDDLE